MNNEISDIERQAFGGLSRLQKLYAPPAIIHIIKDIIILYSVCTMHFKFARANAPHKS